MNTPPFVPIEDVAKYFSVGVSTIRAWVRQGMIPTSTYLKVGNTYRFNIPMIVAALTAANREKDLLASDIDDGKIPVQLELDFNNPDEDA
jgi:excisionase family DNA binding protein